MATKTTETDVAFIAALAELLKSNDLSEIEVERIFAEDDRLNVRVSRNGTPVAMAAPVHVAAAPAAPQPQAAPVAAASSPAQPAASDPADDPNAVTSPMVGTVYLQAEPGRPAFVSVGDTVEEGNTLLIIEAMKTMNQIPAPRSGKVRRILVEDGAPVEFGAPLMIID